MRRWEETEDRAGERKTMRIYLKTKEEKEDIIRSLKHIMRMKRRKLKIQTKRREE